MKKRSLFRVEAERITPLSVLVVAKSKEDAKTLFRRALSMGEVEFENDSFDTYDEMNGCYTVILNDETIREAKDYGVVNRDGKLVYPSKIDNFIEDLENQTASQAKEEWLKKNHMEFGFVSSLKGK